MQLLYLSAFLIGLVLGVYAMIRGVERIEGRGRSPELDAMGRPIGTPRLQLSNPPAFVTGLLLGVYAMIRGVERIEGRGRSPELDAMGRPIGTPRLAFTAPTVGAFATVFGIVGYLLWRYTSLSVGLQL